MKRSQLRKMIREELLKEFDPIRKSQYSKKEPSSAQLDAARKISKEYERLVKQLGAKYKATIEIAQDGELLVVFRDGAIIEI